MLGATRRGFLRGLLSSIFVKKIPALPKLEGLHVLRTDVDSAIVIKEALPGTVQLLEYIDAYGHYYRSVGIPDEIMEQFRKQQMMMAPPYKKPYNQLFEMTNYHQVQKTLRELREKVESPKILVKDTDVLTLPKKDESPSEAQWIEESIHMAYDTITVEHAKYDEFKAKFARGEFGPLRYGQAFYNEFNLSKMEQTDQLNTIYNAQDEEAKKLLDEILTIH